MRLPGLEIHAASIHVKPGGRGKGGGGRSCKRTGAYRSGTCLVEGDQLHDFRRKGGVLHTEFYGWPLLAGERYEAAQQRLWDAVEESETRRDARTFMDVRYTLPGVLSPAQQVEVCRAIAAAMHAEFGVVVDWALHAPHKLHGARYRHQPAYNPHAHMAATTRAPGEDGKFRGAKLVKLYTKKALRWIRRMIARITNEVLRQLGLALRVTHRSIAAEYRRINRRRVAQGLLPLETPEPTKHLGPRAAHLVRTGYASRVQERNETIRDRNAVVLEYNARVQALDEQILRERARATAERLEAPRAVAPLPEEEITVPPAGENDSSPAAAAVEPKGVGTVQAGSEEPLLEPGVSGERGGATAETSKSMDRAVTDAAGSAPIHADGRSDVGAPGARGEEPSSPVTYSRAVAQRVAEDLDAVQHELGMDEHHRAKYEESRGEVQQLIAALADGEDTEMFRAWAADPDPKHRRERLEYLREQAAREPHQLLALTMRWRPNAQREWDQRAQRMGALAEALATMWRHRDAILPAEQRARAEAQRRELAATLRTLDEARRVERRSQAQRGRDRGGPEGPGTGRRGR
jgi:hypothetical protein